MDNIDQFNLWAARILNHLHALFPLANQQVKLVEVHPEATDEDAEIFIATSQFLYDEGFIRYKSVSGSSLMQARLSSKGLSVLQAIPDTLEKHSTVYDRLKAALRIGSEEALKAAVGSAISIGLRVTGVTP